MLGSSDVCDCTCVYVQRHQMIAYSVRQKQTGDLCRGSEKEFLVEFPSIVKLPDSKSDSRHFYAIGINNSNTYWKWICSQLLSEITIILTAIAA